MKNGLIEKFHKNDHKMLTHTDDNLVKHDASILGLNKKCCIFYRD